MMSFNAHVGVIASREHKPQFFTSAVYPLLVEEQYNLGTIAPNHGFAFPLTEEEYTVHNPSVISGVLTETIRYPSINATPDEFILSGFSPVSGSLPVVIQYKSITTPTEQYAMQSAQLISGTLTRVAIYYYHIGPEEYKINSLSIISGTLT